LKENQKYDDMLLGFSNRLECILPLAKRVVEEEDAAALEEITL
jgi:hypothetical protein